VSAALIPSPFTLLLLEIMIWKCTSLLYSSNADLTLTSQRNPTSLFALLAQKIGLECPTDGADRERHLIISKYKLLCAKPDGSMPLPYAGQRKGGTFWP
jgi:hypothetical protein